MNTNSLEKAIQVVGGQSELARKCGISQQNISYWVRRAKRVPAEYVLTIERATNGEVTRHELRPDLYPPEGYTPPEPPDRRSGADRRQSANRRAEESPGRRQGDDRRAADRRREETDAA